MTIYNHDCGFELGTNERQIQRVIRERSFLNPWGSTTPIPSPAPSVTEELCYITKGNFGRRRRVKRKSLLIPNLLNRFSKQTNKQNKKTSKYN